MKQAELEKELDLMVAPYVKMRKELGITQSKMSNECGLTRATIRRLERSENGSLTTFIIYRSYLERYGESKQGV